MKKFKRYGFPKGSLTRDPDDKTSHHGVGVPSRYTDTKGRILFRKILRCLGVGCFSLMCMIIPFIVMDSLGWLNDMVLGLCGVTLGVTVFLSHLGFFLEMGVNDAETNWFSKAAGLFWLYIFGSFLLALAWYLIQLVIS